MDLQTQSLRVGESDVLELFAAFETTPLAERDRFVLEGDKTVVVGVHGATKLGDVVDYICGRPDGVTVAVVPSEKVPLVVFTMRCHETPIEGHGKCEVKPSHNFDMLLTLEEFSCEVWEWTDGRQFKVDVVFPFGWVRDPADLTQRFSISDADGRMLLQSPDAIAQFKAPDLV